MKRWLRPAVGVGAFVFSVYLLLFTPVIVRDQALLGGSLAVFRAAFGMLLWIRLARLRPALPMLWARDREFPWDRHLPLERIVGVWQASAIALAVGFATPLAAAVAYLAGLCVFGRSRFYSVEDILFQAVSFLMVWLNSGQVSSVDAWLGWSFAIPADTVLVANLFWLSLALLMFSAGFEKLFSPLWLRGQGFNAFVGLPHLLQRPFRFVRGWRRTGVVLSWLTMLAELALLPSAVSLPMRAMVTLVLLGFAAGLMFMVDLSFIGQILALGLMLFLWLDATRMAAGIEAASGSASILSLEPSPGVLVLLVALALVIVRLFEIPAGPLARWSAFFARWTVGLAPIRVFTDVHLYGVYIHRLVAKYRTGAERELLPVFDHEGGPGPLQRWYPRVFLGCMYPVTDLCLIVQKYGFERAQASSKFAAVAGLVRCALAGVKPDERTDVEEVLLYVRSIDLDEDSANPGPTFRVSEWVALLSFAAEAGEVGRLTWMSVPPSVRRSPRLV